MRQEMNWPKISVIVPSFNQSLFIEDSLTSVVVQGYPNLELIVIDGGSTDKSVDIIKRFEHTIAYWISEPDKGQTDALIKGFNRSTGDIQCWLNSDDLHESKTLDEVARYFLNHPEIDAVYGDTVWIDKNGKPLREHREIFFNRFIWMYTYNYIPGMSMFWRRSIYDRIGGLNPVFNLAMDADLWIRFADVGKIAHVRRRWSKMRFYSEQKNIALRPQSDEEELEIRRRYWRNDYPLLWKFRRGIALLLRAGLRLLTGCYSFNYKRNMSQHLSN